MDGGEILQGRGGMIGFLKDMRDRIRGAGDYAITVPPMDGTLLPNNDLEAAPVLVKAEDPGHLGVSDNRLWFASGSRIMRMVKDGAPEEALACDAQITALAIGPDARPCVAFADGTWSMPEGYSLDALPEKARRCITSMCFGADGACFVAVGSTENVAADWARDLLERRNSGSVWKLTTDGKAVRLADRLSWPAGLLAVEGGVLASEASRARVIRIGADGAATPVLSNLPGYPAGLARASDGGFHLCIMAPRNQLIEFILREREFVHDMIAETDREHWIAPSLNPPDSFLEPLQGGALKQLGIMKPWAPSRSGGLVIRLSAEFVPTGSHHSRADGRNHGTMSCIEWDGSLIVSSHGNDRLLKLPLEGGSA